MSDSSDLVRIAFAESLASLAETSRRFLETSYAMRRAAAAAATAASASAAASAAAAITASMVDHQKVMVFFIRGLDLFCL